MKLFYRISDNSYPKIKAPGATKQVCFENFLEAFRPYNPEECTIVADNCGPETLKYLYGMQANNPFRCNFSIVETNHGNAGSLLSCIQKAAAVKNYVPVYFVEDDYLHDPSKAYHLLREGSYVSPQGYWTLYDHPDKYSHFYQGGEIGKVQRTDRSHWRESISTTMTFACNTKTLAEDVSIWDEHLRDVLHPPDHRIFMKLREKERILNVAIPGVACHTDLTYSGLVNKVTLDKWAIEILFDKHFKKALELNDEIVNEHLNQMFNNSTPEPNMPNLIRLMAVLEGLKVLQ